MFAPSILWKYWEINCLSPQRLLLTPVIGGNTVNLFVVSYDLIVTQQFCRFALNYWYTCCCRHVTYFPSCFTNLRSICLKYENDLATTFNQSAQTIMDRYAYNLTCEEGNTIAFVFVFVFFVSCFIFCLALFRNIYNFSKIFLIQL